MLIYQYSFSCVSMIDALSASKDVLLSTKSLPMAIEIARNLLPIDHKHDVTLIAGMISMIMAMFLLRPAN